MQPAVAGPEPGMDFPSNIKDETTKKYNFRTMLGTKLISKKNNPLYHLSFEEVQHQLVCGWATDI